MHLLTAFEDRSGVRSSSAISTQPSDRTANRIDRSVSDLSGKLRRLEICERKNVSSGSGMLIRKAHFSAISSLLRRSSSWSSAELVLLRVTDVILSCSRPLLEDVELDSGLGVPYRLTSVCENIEFCMQRGVGATAAVAFVFVSSCVVGGSLGHTGGSRWIVPDLMCQ